MLKAEAEKIVRHFAFEWARETRYESGLGNLPSYGTIRAKVKDNAPDALRFRSVAGAYEDVERWIDDELKVPGN